MGLQLSTDMLCALMAVLGRLWLVAAWAMEVAQVAPQLGSLLGLVVGLCGGLRMVGLGVATPQPLQNASRSLQLTAWMMVRLAVQHPPWKAAPVRRQSLLCQRVALQLVATMPLAPYRHPCLLRLGQGQVCWSRADPLLHRQFHFLVQQVLQLVLLMWEVMAACLRGLQAMGSRLHLHVSVWRTAWHVQAWAWAVPMRLLLHMHAARPAWPLVCLATTGRWSMGLSGAELLVLDAQGGPSACCQSGIQLIACQLAYLQCDKTWLCGMYCGIYRVGIHAGAAVRCVLK